MIAPIGFFSLIILTAASFSIKLKLSFCAMAKKSLPLTNSVPIVFIKSLPIPLVLNKIDSFGFFPSQDTPVVLLPFSVMSLLKKVTLIAAPELIN